MITSASATQIVTTVPDGASTGPISITTPAGSAASDSPFTVGTSSPTITDFTPAVGSAGASVNINGTNFDSSISGNRLSFNGKRTLVNTAAATAITANVPTGAASGRISISTGAGKGTSADYFFVPPPPFTAADVEMTGQMAIGSSKTVTVATANKIALIVFEGTAGQNVSLRTTGSTIASSTINIYNPDGTIISSTTANTTGGFIDAHTLSASGTYTILVDPQTTNTGSLTLNLNNIVHKTGTITPGGPAETVTTTTPGQNARLTFSGTTGQRISLKVDSTTYGANNSQLVIYNPDGTALASDTNVNAGDYIDTKTLPADGTYTIVVDPDLYHIGSMAIKLNDTAEATGDITPGGPAVTITIASAGQNARLSFTGTTGQRVSLRMTGVTIASSALSIIKPDGTNLVAPTTITTTGGFFDTKVLPADGTYTILIDPASSNTGNMTLTLYDVPADVTGSTSIGAPAIPVSITTPGQNALLTFAGTAGQQVTVRMTGNTMSTTAVKLLRPDGTTLTSSSSSGSSFNLTTQTLPTTGTYTISIDPSGANTGNINIGVTTP